MFFVIARDGLLFADRVPRPPVRFGRRLVRRLDRRAEARVRPRDASSPSSAYSSSSSTRPYLPPRANYSPPPPPARVQRSEATCHATSACTAAFCMRRRCAGLRFAYRISDNWIFWIFLPRRRAWSERWLLAVLLRPCHLQRIFFDLMFHNLCGCFGSRWASLDSLAPASASLPVRYVSAHLNVSA